MTSEDIPDRATVQAAAYRLLARRDHARGELTQKLRQRHFPDILIQQVLDECEQAGYLDDERFAAEQGRILAKKAWGPRQIAHKLRARGVADHILSKIIDEITDELDLVALAKQRLLRRFGPPHSLDETQRQRAYRHLIYRGYSSHLVRRILFEP